MGDAGGDSLWSASVSSAPLWFSIFCFGVSPAAVRRLAPLPGRGLRHTRGPG
jgi:hypothetical protein